MKAILIYLITCSIDSFFNRMKNFSWFKGLNLVKSWVRIFYLIIYNVKGARRHNLHGGVNFSREEIIFGFISLNKEICFLFMFLALLENIIRLYIIESMIGNELRRNSVLLLLPKLMIFRKNNECMAWWLENYYIIVYLSFNNYRKYLSKFFEVLFFDPLKMWTATDSSKILKLEKNLGKPPKSGRKKVLKNFQTEFLKPKKNFKTLCRNSTGPRRLRKNLHKIR